LKGIEKYGLSPESSLMIGDRETDMQAARAACIGTKLLICPEKPEHTAADFWITGLHQVMDYL
jgi:phosphoglycolate phosphatase-like HAD superfamily hydrolase